MVSKIERLEKITSKTRKNNSKRLDPLRTTHFFFFILSNFSSVIRLFQLFPNTYVDLSIWIFAI